MNRTLQFASSNRVQKGGVEPFDVLRLGRAALTDDGTGTLSYWLYDARQNLPQINAKVHHPKLGKGEPGPIQIPRYTLAADFKKSLRLTWKEAGDDLTLTVGQAIHRWQKQPGLGGHYTLAGPHVAVDGSPTIDGLTYLQGYGYAAFTEAADAPHPLTKEDFAPLYKGEVCQLIGGAATWDRTPALWHMGWYTFFPGKDGDVLGYAGPGKKDMRAFYSLLMNYKYAPYSRLMLYYGEGNDYNHDDALNEYAHAWQMFGCWIGGRVRAIVGIEHSYQTRGYPILGTVLYFEA